ncbi:MAG TPA: hypothetical protein GX401_00230 [Clostridiales bacterium]|nr:hypothetical protein [Clostridiales bacterium]
MFQIKIYGDKHNSIGMLIHSFSTYDKVKRWKENANSKSAQKPYITEVSDILKNINVYAVASTKYQFSEWIL